MTREQAKSELMQIYGSLSEEKKKALDVAFKAMEQADNIPAMYYPQVDGITPTVVAQADGEKTCGTCRNEDTYHCAECENKSDYEQSQADGEYITQSAGDEIRQKNYDLISRQAVLDMLEDINAETEGVGFYYEHYVDYIKSLPSVNPQEPKKCKDCKYETYPDNYYPCCDCKHNYVDKWQKKPHWNHGVCDNCGYDWGKDAPIASVPNFCPDCGSPMEIER